MSDNVEPWENVPAKCWKKKWKPTLEDWETYFTSNSPDLLAKPCPACIYDNGKFIRFCALHQKIHNLEQALAAAQQKWFDPKDSSTYSYPIKDFTLPNK
jgi:hypothetical protein